MWTDVGRCRVDASEVAAGRGEGGGGFNLKKMYICNYGDRLLWMQDDVIVRLLDDILLITSSIGEIHMVTAGAV